MQIQRLNLDNSWLLNWENTSLLIDPWLLGSEIDGATWLNEQWHKTAPVPIEKLPAYDGILVTQSYSDHCHINTLKVLNIDVPILATQKAANRIKKAKLGRKLIPIFDFPKENGVVFGKLRITVFRPARLLDPIYYAIIISNQKKDAIFIAPHGFEFTKIQKAVIQHFNFRTLITTFSNFQLPFFLGGKVNPGMENVEYLRDLLEPDYILNTHDEEKGGRGLVLKMAKIEFPNYEKILQRKDLNFQYINDYEMVTLKI